MAKQIYIDENGNEQLVSGTINNAELLPIQSGSATNTKDYIDSVKNDLSDNVITETYKTITSGDITADSGLSLHTANQVYRLGRFCLLTISIKINRSVSGNCYITNYIPTGYRPILEISTVIENGLGDGKAQPIKIGTDGKLTIYPITLNTNTYAIGTVFYPLAEQ